MEKKIGKIVKQAGFKAGDAVGKAKNVVVKVVDQNGDGKVDLEDVKLVGVQVKHETKKIVDLAQEKMNAQKVKSLNSFYSSDLEKTALPKLVQIVARDKNYDENSLCKGSIGFMSDNKTMPLLNVFADSIQDYELSFYPNEHNRFYYVDPSNERLYIALDNYYDYLKIARVSELQSVAQSLGAKHFKVSYKEQTESFINKKGVLKEKGNGVQAEAKQTVDTKSRYKMKIESEMYFSGHQPFQPILQYLKNDPAINSLISMRMAEEGDFQKQNLEIKLSDSSGLNKELSTKIDEILTKFKFKLEASMSQQYKKESNSSLIYEIEF